MNQPTATAGGNTTICVNSTYTLLSGEATSSNGTILWTENGAGSITAGATTLFPTYTPAPGDAGNAVTLTLMVSNSPCPPAPATYTINVVGFATASAGGPLSICANGSAVNITAGSSASNYSGVLWSSSGTGTFNNANSLSGAEYLASAADITAGTVTLTLTAFGNAPCGDIASNKIVTITAAPQATGVTICQGQAGVAMTSSTSCGTGTTITVGPVSAGTGANINGLGANWNNPGNIGSSDNNRAIADIGTNSVSDYLKASGFGFAIPAGAIIDGIQVSIERQEEFGGGNVRVRDNDVLLVSGATVSNDKASSTFWTDADVIANYGGVADNWGASWTPALINDPSFGVQISASKYINSCQSRGEN